MTVGSRRSKRSSKTGAGPAILFTNNALTDRGGTELYIRDLAFALRDRGYRPMAYSQSLGEMSAELQDGGVVVVDDLTRLPQEPDLIHAHHHVESVTAMLAFPSVPAVFVCHGTGPWQEEPPRSPTIRAYVAVSDQTRDQVVSTCNVAADSVVVIPNFVDLSRFPSRSQLPAAPRSVLVMSNQAALSGFAGVIAAECERRGIACTVRGRSSGAPVRDPAAVMARADVVVAAGRTALEAMATGCAVIVADAWGLSGLVTSGNFEAMRRGNFGLHTAQTELSQDTFSAALDCYDPAEAQLVQSRVRDSASLSAAIARWEAVYAAAMAPNATDPADLCRAASTHLATQTPWIKAGHGAPGELRKLSDQVSLLTQEAADLRAELDASEARARDLQDLLQDHGEQLSWRTGVRGATRNLRRALQDRAARTLRLR